MTTATTPETGVKSVRTVTLTIDGVKTVVRAGTTVLEAAQQASIYIPTLCWDEDLTPYGACRLCIVEIENMRGLPTSCTTMATDGMVVRTDTPAVESSRRATIELIMANHLGDCLTCAQNQNCELQRVARYVGVDEAHFKRLRKSAVVRPLDDSNPAYIRDMNKCILCARCVRACHESPGSTPSTSRSAGTQRQSVGSATGRSSYPGARPVGSASAAAPRVRSFTATAARPPAK
jgi:NADH dehydrogenase/NADH:ubiquinone oxidoreductase subunit G